jgi:hypothetical protein
MKRNLLIAACAVTCILLVSGARNLMRMRSQAAENALIRNLRLMDVAKQQQDNQSTNTMRYQNQIDCMKALAATFDEIGYVGTGRQGLTRCIAAFEAGDKDSAIREYRKTIGAAPNFASALTDLNTDKLSTELQNKYGSQLIGIMVTMSLLMNGAPK